MAMKNGRRVEFFYWRSCDGLIGGPDRRGIERSATEWFGCDRPGSFSRSSSRDNRG
jgi:hypothetical protein